MSGEEENPFIVTEGQNWSISFVTELNVAINVDGGLRQLKHCLVLDVHPSDSLVMSRVLIF